MDAIRVAGIVKESVVDGKGLRLTVYTQGCPHACPGCHNPHTHPAEGGYDLDPSEIIDMIKKNPLLQGVTLSGGEPFAQPDRLVGFVRAVKDMGLDLWCYTGYTFEQLVEMSREDDSASALLRLTDVLVDGPFLLEQRDLSLAFRGSRNQRILDVGASFDSGRATEFPLE